MAEGARHIEVARRGLFRQRWRARFYADNGAKIVVSIGYHANLGELKAMLATYFPDWTVEVIGRQK